MRKNGVGVWQRLERLFLCSFAVFCCFWCFGTRAGAAPLQNVPTLLVQPDGTEVAAFSSGDEAFNYLHDAAGSLIVQDSQGWYVYAVDRDGRPVPSGKRVGAEQEKAPRTLSLYYEEKAMTAEEAAPAASSQTAKAPAGTAARIGWGSKVERTVCNLVVFLRFQGEEEYLSGPASSPRTAQMDYSATYEKVMRYFDKISDGGCRTATVFLTADPMGETACSYEDSHTRNYYRLRSASNPEGYSAEDGDLERTQREMELLKNALKAVLPSLPDGAALDGDGDGMIDNITFIADGEAEGWSQILWPHNWALQGEKIMVEDGKGREKQAFNFNFLFASPESGDVGVVSHELLHTVGFPDLYRSAGAGAGQPVGGWDVMGAQNSEDPQFPGAYMAYAYGGWGHLEYAVSDGVYTLKPLGTDDGSPDGYLIPTGDPTQWIAAEYRKNGALHDVTQDNVPRDGLLLYRVDMVTDGGSSGGSSLGGDEVYVFRPGDTAVNAGTSSKLSQASLSQNWEYTALGADSGEVPVTDTLYLTEGVNSRVAVSEVTEREDGTLSFRLTLPDREPAAPGIYDLSQGDFFLSAPGEYSFTGTTDCHRITVAAGVEGITVILDGVQADLSASAYGSPVYLEAGASADVILRGENRLTGGQYESAVHVAEGAKLTLSGPGSLEAVGGGGAAAIGGNAFQTAGSLRLSGVTLSATGGGSFALERGGAKLTGGPAPALGAGAGQTCGSVVMEDCDLTLTAGVDSETGEKAAALALCPPGGAGGSLTGTDCIIQGDSGLRAGDSLSLEGCRVTVEQTEPGTDSCLTARDSVTLRNCDTTLRAGPDGAAVGGPGTRSVAVSGGSLWAASADYTLYANTVSLDGTARLFLSSGKTETLFSGLFSGGSPEPVPIQPGLPFGADSRATLLQGTLEEALGGQYSLQAYRDGRLLGSLLLPAGCRTFAVTVPGQGDYFFRASDGGETEAAAVSGQGVTRAGLLRFERTGNAPAVPDLSAGAVSITESGEYLLSGKGTTVSIADGLSVVLRLRDAELTASSGRAAISAGAGSRLTLFLEDGSKNRLTGGSGMPAIKGEAVAFQGTGELYALGGGSLPALSALSASTERNCRLFLASRGEVPAALTENGSWDPGWGEAPILLTGVLKKSFAAGAEAAFRGVGEFQAWQLPQGFRSFCKTLSACGDVVIVTGLSEESPALPCSVGENFYQDIPLTRWNNSTQKLDLSQEDAFITENGTYELSGSTSLHTVRVKDGVTAVLQLNGLKINLLKNTEAAQRKGIIELGKNCSVAVASSGEGNSLTNGDGDSRCAVVYVPASSRLTGEFSQPLTAAPGGMGPLFGTPEDEEAGEILLSGGTVNCEVQYYSGSSILVGGRNAEVTLGGCTLSATGGPAGAVGGPGARVSVTGGALELSGGTASGTLGGENARVSITGGQIGLQIGEGDVGVGGKNAEVRMSGGAVTVSDTGDPSGGMRAGAGGAGASVSVTGGTLRVNILRTASPDWGALGGEGAFLSAGGNARVFVAMKQVRNTPLIQGTQLDPAMAGGFGDVRMTAAFGADTQVRFCDAEGDPQRSLIVPPRYYGFFAYLPAGVCSVMDSGGSCAGTFEILPGQVAGLENAVFDKIAGVLLKGAVLTYNSRAQSLKLSGALPEDAEVTYENNGQVMPGEYTVTARIAYSGRSYELTAPLTIEKAPLTVSKAVAEDKEQYDGSCETAGELILRGGQGTDVPTASAVFRFETPDVGTDKKVLVSGVRLDPEWADRYVLLPSEAALEQASASVLRPCPLTMAFRPESLWQEAGHAAAPAVETGFAGGEVPLQFTYDGSEELPQQAGVYEVKAVPASPNFQGSAQGSLTLAAPEDLSKGDVVVTRPGTYYITGRTDRHRIVVDVESPADVTLVLRDAKISLSGEGEAPLQVINGGTVRVIVPEASGSVLRAGPGASVVEGPTSLCLELSGAGSLLGFAGENAPGLEPAAVHAVSPETDCCIFSTLPGQGGEPAGKLLSLSFAVPAPADVPLILECGLEERKAFVLPAGYQSVLLTPAGSDPLLLDGEGRKICCVWEENTNLPFRAEEKQEETVELSHVGAGPLVLSEDGVYRLTGEAAELEIVAADGVEASLILDGASFKSLTAQKAGRLTLVCEKDSVIENGIINGGAGSLLRLEGPGALRIPAGGVDVEKLVLSGNLDACETAADQDLFTGQVVLEGGSLKAKAAGADSAVFGENASLAASHGRAELEAAGENSVGFRSWNVSLSGDAEAVLAVTGKNGTGVVVPESQTGGVTENACFLAAAAEDAACLTGGADWAGGALLLAELKNGLTAVGGSRELTLSSASRPSWKTEISLPETEKAYGSLLAVLPVGGDYEFSCAADPAQEGVCFSALAEDVPEGLSQRTLSFELLPRIAGLSLEEEAFGYDGEEKRLTLSGVPAGAQVCWENNGQTEPGMYEVRAFVSLPGFRTEELSGRLTIEKRVLEVSVRAQDKPLYDGSTAAEGEILLKNALEGDEPRAVGVFTFENADVGLQKRVFVTNIALVEDENNWGAHYVLDKTEAETEASIPGKAKARITLSDLTQEYGSVTGVRAEAEENLKLHVFYDGAAEVPKLPGEYEVTAEIKDKNRFGTASGVFRVTAKSVSITGLKAPEIQDDAEALTVDFADSEAFDREASGILPGDRVLVSGTAVYPDRTAGEKAVAFTGLTLSGEEAGRYVLSSAEAQGTGTVIGTEPVDPTPPDPPGPPGPVGPVGPVGPSGPSGPEPVEPKPEPPAFTDVETHWAKDSILAVAERGLMTGAGGSLFEPGRPMSRAMLMSVLCRLDQADPGLYEGSAYSDVPEGSWFAACVQWARETGVGLGMDDGTFHPGDPVSREQIAVFLYRFTQYRGLEAAGTGELPFHDGEEASFWAEEALSWAVERGILVGGTDGLLNPLGKASRAEVAAMLDRYLSAYEPLL